MFPYNAHLYVYVHTHIYGYVCLVQVYLVLVLLIDWGAGTHKLSISSKSNPKGEGLRVLGPNQIWKEMWLCQDILIGVTGDANGNRNREQRRFRHEFSNNFHVGDRTCHNL